MLIITAKLFISKPFKFFKIVILIFSLKLVALFNLITSSLIRFAAEIKKMLVPQEGSNIVVSKSNS